MIEHTILMIDTDEELKKIIRRLNSLHDQLGAPDILIKALHSTGRKVRKQIIKDAEGRYALSNKKVLTDKSEGGPEVLTNKSELTATIRSSGPMQDIMTFMTRPNNNTGAAAAKVLNSSSMKELQKGDLKAFVTRFASGHVAIVQRDPPNEYSVGRSKRASKYGANSDMTKLKKLLSPSVPHMLNNEEIREKASAMTYDLLQAEIEKHIAKVLRKTA